MVRRRSNTSISLFPFLAVLVCTMGALILLLLVTTRRMRPDADRLEGPVADELVQIASADGPPLFNEIIVNARPDLFVITPEETRQAAVTRSGQDTEISLKDPVSVYAPLSDDAQVLASPDEQADLLQRLRKQLDAEFERHKALVQKISRARLALKKSASDRIGHQQPLIELADLRQQESELSAKLELKTSQLEQLKSELERTSRETEQGELILSQRKSALIQLRDLVRDSSEDLAGGTEQTVIEFSNSTGTRRSPIIVDVTAGGYEFLPAGARVTTSDMEGFPANDNPLLAGTLAIHENRVGQTGGIKPYVLLLIRPDGSLNFYAAQRVLKDAGIHFGYELLEQNHQIAGGRRDPSESAAVRDAVLAALERRQTLYSGIAARIAQLREQEQQRQSDPVDDQRVIMTPDGRLLKSSETLPDADGFNDAPDGRFYAGGYAPPKQVETWTPVPRASAEPAPTSGLPSSLNEPAIDSAFAGGNSADHNEADSLLAKLFGSADPGGVEAAESLKSAASAAESDTTQPPPADALADVRELYARPGMLAGNMGAGSVRTPAPPGGSSTAPSKTADANPFAELADVNSEPDGNSQLPADWPSSPAADNVMATRTVGPAENSPESLSDAQIAGNTSSSNEPGFLGSQLDQTVVPENQSGSGPSFSAFGETQASPFSGQTSDTETFLQKFMQQVEDQKPSTRPDPMLVSLMNAGFLRAGQQAPVTEATPSESTTLSTAADKSGEQTSLSDAAPAKTADAPGSATENPFAVMAANEQAAVEAWSEAATQDAGNPSTFPVFDQPEADDRSAGQAGDAIVSSGSPSDTQTSSNEVTSKPAASATPDRVYYVIKIYVQKNQITIGDFEAVETDGWSQQELVALTLQAVSATMENVWATIRKDAVPAVRFLNEPGAEDIQEMLTKELAKSDVPTRGIQQRGPALSVDDFFSPSLPPCGQAVTPSPTSGGTGTRPDPAEPVEVPVVPRSQRSSSI
ncbi:MAG: hypothetical protein R3C49_07055 [Planctomycetaceae bacterium]